MSLSLSTFFTTGIYPQNSLVSKSTTYTALTSDNIIECDTSGAGFSVNLYPASGNAGRVLTFKMVGTGTNALTVDPNASETIDGVTTTTLNTQYESLTIACNGSNWSILDRRCITELVAYTPTFTGFGTATSVSFFSRRVGDCLHIIGKCTTGTATGVEARVTLGFGGTNANVTADATKIASIRNVGSWALSATSATVVKAVLIESGVGYITFGINVTVTAELTKTTGSTFGNTTDISMEAIIPITGWHA